MSPRRRRPATRAARARARAVVARLARAMPEARMALRFGDDLQLLVSVILSAQTTDARVNQVTPALFARFPDAAAWARAEPEDLWPLVRSLGLYRTKARAVVGAMRIVEAQHGGRVPRTRQALEALPGVGRKTAGVVLLHLGAEHAFPVDTHVGRVSRRLGFTREIHPDRVEEDLRRLLRPERWGTAHQLLVWHGRRTCAARTPACRRCPVEDLCPKRGVLGVRGLGPRASGLGKSAAGRSPRGA
ncbi:MAG TPA: endonuclease III [Anaeromyxobacteraceae bacterium]|nr:endonuclease III [Anaeromyxobacteraceae bacterium]